MRYLFPLLVLIGGIMLIVSSCRDDAAIAKDAEVPEIVSLAAVLERGLEGNRNLEVKDFDACARFAGTGSPNQGGARRPSWWVGAVPTTARAGQGIACEGRLPALFRTGRGTERAKAMGELEYFRGALVGVGIGELPAEVQAKLRLVYPKGELEQALIIEDDAPVPEPKRSGLKFGAGLSIVLLGLLALGVAYARARAEE